MPDQAYLLDKMRSLGYNSDISFDNAGKQDESSAVAKPCNCKVLLNHSQYLFPVKDLIGQRTFKSNDRTIAGLWQNKQMNGGYHFNRGNYGPAMYAHLVTTGHKVGGERSKEFGSTKEFEKAGTSIHASLLYNLLCSAQSDIMEGCACRRVIQAAWMYEMNISAEARLGQNTVTWERKSYTTAENIVVVSKSHGQNTQVLSSKRHTVNAVCNAVRDTTLINGILSLAGTAGRIIAGDTLKPETVTQIQNAIKDLLPGNTGYYIVNECSSSTAVDVELARGQDTITLHAGGPIRRLDLMSFFGFKGGGKRNWQNASRIHSNFYLVGSIPGGTDLSNEGGEGFKPCCTQKTATYISATVPGSVKTESQLRQSLWSNFLFLYQPWQRINDIPTHGGIQVAHLLDQHYGKLLYFMPETDSCRFIEIVISPPAKAFVESRIHQESVIKVFPDQLVIILENSDELIDQSIRYVLSDMQGRVLASGSEAVQREVNIPVKQDMAWQLPGICLFTYQIGRELPVTLKINKI